MLCKIRSAERKLQCCDGCNDENQYEQGCNKRAELVGMSWLGTEKRYGT